MMDIATILQQEIWFCESFTRKVVTDYGVLFYNPDNPQSHDSNHANILRLDDDLDAITREIVQFYTHRNLTPRIYNSYQEHEFEILRPHLEAHGFTVSTHDTSFMVWDPAQHPQVDAACEFRRITQISDDLVELIHSDADNGDWTINVLKNHFRDRQFHLLGLYEEGHCRAIASMKMMEGYSRVDDVNTHADFRGRHLGTKLMNYLLAYHAEASDNLLYLYADNPIAIKLYKNIGFQEFEIDRAHWSAYVPD